MDRARSALTRLARAELDNDSFRYEAAAILRRAVGFDGWCWLLADPAAQLLTRELGEDMVVDKAIRSFLRALPDAWDQAQEPARRPRRDSSHRPAPVKVLSEETGGDLSRDWSWRQMFGPAGVGDKMRAQLVADGTCWAALHLHRDSSSRYYSEEEAEFVAGVAPLLAARLRAGLRALGPPNDPAREPGTIIMDEDLSLVAATEQACQWIDLLGLPPANDAEPLPGVIYLVAARVASSPQRPAPPAWVRLQAADGRWLVVRAAALTGGSQAALGYAITLQPAHSEDLAPLLMRAWALTSREREVARLVMDGLSSEAIAAALFVSVHTVRDHLKTIFRKMGVSRRQDLVTALGGGTPGSLNARNADSQT